MEPNATKTPPQASDQFTDPVQANNPEPTATGSMGSAGQPLLQPSKPKRKKLLLFVLLAILLTGAAAALYFAFQKDDKTSNTQSPATSTAITTSSSLSEIIAKLKSDAAGLNLVEKEDTTPVTYIDITRNGVSGFSFAKASNAATFTYAKTYDFSRSEGKDSQSDYCDLAKSDFAPVRTAYLTYFKDAGFSETKVEDLFGSYQYNDCSDGYIEERSNEYCTVVISFSSVSAGCTDKTAATTKAKQAYEVATALNAFHKYTGNRRNIVGYFEIEKSMTPGYEIIYQYSLEIGALDLYRKEGATSWNVLDEEANKSGENCSLFTGEAKLAFKGKTCIDSSKKEQII